MLCFHLYKLNQKNNDYFGILNHKNNIKFKFHSYHTNNRHLNKNRIIK